MNVISKKFRTAQRGFTLIELMVAILLGILISIGLVVLFGATSKTNRVQDAMARLQENGRFALIRMNADLRMIMHNSVLNISSFSSTPVNSTSTPNGGVTATTAPDIYVASLPLPDSGPNGVTPPTGWAAATHWPLSSRYMVQGYECSSGNCSGNPGLTGFTAVPTGANSPPAAGTTAGSRLKSADMLTIRYLNADGWSLQAGELAEKTSSPDTVSCAGTNLVSLTVTPAATSAPFNFVTNDYAYLMVGSSSVIFQVQVAGTTLTPINVVGGPIPCFAQPTGSSGASTSAILYNYSKDMVTQTYYVRLDADPNTAGRLIPTLVRRQSTIDTIGAASNEQAIAQGVEQLDFLYGVDRADGTTEFLTADDTQMAAESTTANCPKAPVQYKNAGLSEPQCLWRSIKSVEVHVLMNSVNDMFDLTPTDQAYQYSYGYAGSDAAQTPTIPSGATLPSGLATGAMLRREFVELVALRNYNP